MNGFLREMCFFQKKRGGKEKMFFKAKNKLKLNLISLKRVICFALTENRLRKSI